MCTNIDIGILIKKANNLIDRCLNNITLENKLLGGTQGLILRRIYESKNSPIYQKDLEKEFETRRSSMSQILESLEKDHLIKRVTTNEDKRLKKLIITKQGEKECELMAKKVVEFEAKLTDILTDKEAGNLKNNLEKLISSLKKLEEEENGKSKTDC